MKAKIFARDLQRYRPYAKMDEFDIYYARVASRCLEVMEYSDALDMDEDDSKSVAIMMALYLEDVVSGLGIWQTFTEEMKARYGYFLPFYAIDESDYVHEEINIADVCFMLWRRLQLRATDKNIIINPLDTGIAFVAESIMTVLDVAYEEAPENVRLLKFMQGITFDADDFLATRDILRWMHYGCYLFAENLEELNDFVEQRLRHDRVVTEERKRQETYMIDCVLIFASNTQLLSLTTPEWAEKMLSRHTDTSLLRTIKAHGIQTYRYVETTESDYVFEEVDDEKKPCPVTKMSIELDEIEQIAKELKDSAGEGKDGNLYISANLVEYGGKYWVNGAIHDTDSINAAEQLRVRRMWKANHKAKEEAYQKVLEKNNGDWIRFFKTIDEVNQFLTETLGYGMKDDDEQPPFNDSEGLCVFCTPQDGITVMQKCCYCVAHPNNPFYDKERAKENALIAIVNRQILPYSVSVRLQEEGLLPDAYLKSFLGDEYGRELVRKNARFLTDYFRNTYAEREAKRQL